MPISSNIDQVADWLRESVAGVNFNMPADNAQLGGVCAREIAIGIQERAFNEQKGAVEEWPENSPGYKRYKGRHYGIELTNFRTQQMLLLGSLEANVHVEDDGKTTVMEYGTDQVPTDSASGTLTATDQVRTDTQKAHYAHEQGRSFYEIDQKMDNERIMPVLRRALKAHLEERARS